MASMERHLVIVVGAGMAGLSAAQHLVARGLSDVLVLEAGDRIGGRIHTVVFGADDQSLVNMGAANIEGSALTNSALVLANERGLLKVSSDKFVQRTRGYFYRPDGQVIDPEVSTRAWKNLLTWLDKSEPERIRNVPMYLRQRLDEAFSQDLFTTGEQQDVLAVYNCFLRFVSTYYGGPLSDQNTTANNTYNIPGGIIRVSGMNALVDALRSDLKENQVKLNYEVTRIYLEQGTVRLECSNGARFIADHVIVTCSLGYLKQHASTLFDPPLSPDYMNAISRIGFGAMGKIYLRYDRPFWTKGDGRICLAWTAQDIENESDWYTSIWTFTEVTDNDNVLVAAVGFEGVEKMEQTADESIKVICTDLLRKFLRNPSIPMPLEVLKTTWMTNPLFRGTYCYLSKSTNMADFQALAKPIIQNEIPRILFAGEAVSGGGCIHDARETGLRQSEVILALFGQSASK